MKAKHMSLACALLAFLLMFPSAQVSLAADVVVHYHERPPYYETCPDGFGGIIGQRVRAVFDEAGISYDTQKTPAKRQLAILQDNNGPDCMVGWFLTPRRKTFAQYSKAIYQDRSMVVLTREDNKVFDRPFTLSELLSAKTLQLLMKDGYSYGLVIDFMVKYHKPINQLTTAGYDNMVRMIHAKRADYMFIGSEEVELLISRSGLPRKDFRIIYPRGMPPFNKRYLLFSRNVDPEIVERVNQAIEKLYPIKE